MAGKGSDAQVRVVGEGTEIEKGVGERASHPAGCETGARRGLRLPRPWARRNRLTRLATLGVHGSRALAFGNRPGRGFEPPPTGLIGRQGALVAGLDGSSDLFQGFGREHGAHLGGACLVALHAGDSPQLHEEAGSIAVNRPGGIAPQLTRTPMPATAVPRPLALTGL